MKFYNLQLLRFFAASAVIFFHNYLTGNPRIDFFIHKGDFAVGLFFILSGFVISNSLISKPSGFKTYFRKRFQKIFPLWIFSVVLNVAIAGKLIVSASRVLLSLALLQSIYPNFALDLNFVGWSLSVEFLMYLVMYLIIIKWDISSKWFELTAWVVWLVTQIAFVYCLKTMGASASFDYHNFLLYNPIWHLNEFLLGILLTQKVARGYTSKFFAYKYATQITILGYVAILMSAFLIGFKLGVERFYHDGFLAPVTGVFIIFLVMIEKKKNTGKNKPTRANKLFDLLGAISFGMYLFHMPLFYLLNPFIKVSNGTGNFLIYYAAVIAFSYLAYLVIERSYIKLSENIFGSSKKTKPNPIQKP